MASSFPLLVFLKPPSSSSLFIRPPLLFIKSLHTLFPSPPLTRPRFFCSSSSSSSSSVTFSQTPPPSSLLLQQQQQENHIEYQTQQEEEEGGESQTAVKAPSLNSNNLLPTLTVKEKKELAAYAHSLGKKLKIQQVGKSGITDSVAAAFVENLESNELLKLKIQNSCPGELPEVIKQLELATGAVAVGHIGRSVILYRPSLTKLKAEEKKRQAQRVAAKKGYRVKPTEFRVKPAEFGAKPSESKRTPVLSRLSGRGRRGSSRIAEP